MLAYSIKHKTEIAKLKQDLKAIIEQGKQLSIDYYFAFHEDRLIWKRKKTLRRLDVDNRIKAIQDQLSLILNIDDSYFISGHREKVIQQEDQPECVTVKIKQTNLRSLSAVNLDK
jgi:Holliday junction resolvase RusA-like endonuclease